MGRVKAAVVYLEENSDHAPDPTEADLEALAAEYDAQCSPKPIPCDPSEESPTLDAWDLFTPNRIASVIERNRDWMQWTNRTTSEVLGALFINVDFAGMTDMDAMRRVSLAVFDAGYHPSVDSVNPVWTFPV